MQQPERQKQQQQISDIWDLSIKWHKKNITNKLSSNHRIENECVSS